MVKTKNLMLSTKTRNTALKLINFWLCKIDEAATKVWQNYEKILLDLFNFDTKTKWPKVNTTVSSFSLVSLSLSLSTINIHCSWCQEKVVKINRGMPGWILKETLMLIRQKWTSTCIFTCAFTLLFRNFILLSEWSEHNV